MTDLFKRRRDIAICPWTKESHLGKCSNRKLHTLTLVNGGTLKSIGNFASALSNVNNVKISDFDFDLEFFVKVLFSPFCSHPKIICRKLQDFWGEFFNNLKNLAGRSFFPLLSELWKNILEWLLSYKVTSCNL